jgi:hypothetical protein
VCVTFVSVFPLFVQLDSFLGLMYPSTDIPPQARALYVRNKFRMIGDVVRMTHNTQNAGCRAFLYFCVSVLDSLPLLVLSARLWSVVSRLPVCNWFLSTTL